MKEQLNKVDFEVIRYASLWEDADVLLEGLSLNPSSRVMSIASAGDNCFSMLSEGIEQCIAVDISAVQLYLVELKKVAIQQLDRITFMRFVGFQEDDHRLETYHNLKANLSSDALNYWNQQTDAIKEGVIHTGKFERYFQLFKQSYLHKIHPQSTIDELFRSKSAAEQLAFHDNKWHTVEWKEMYGHFFGKQMMGDHGRDPEFLKHVKGEVSELILQQEINAIRKPCIQQNYFLYYILNNRFDEGYLPHYVREENYEKVKANIDALILHHGLLDSAIEEHEACSHYNLSDIFEYMDDELFKTVAQSIVDHARNGARIAYWNLMIPRKIAEILPRKVTHLEDLSMKLKELDKGYFYQAFLIDEVK